MGIFSKKKKDKQGFEDQWGETFDPYRTDQQSLDDIGVYPVVGRPSKKKSIERRISKGIAIAVGLSLVTAVALPFRAANKANEAMVYAKSAQTTSFKTRYDDLGRSVILSYYAGTPTPPVNVMAGVQWNSGIDSGNSRAANNAQTTLAKIENLALVSAIQQTASMSVGEKGGVFTNPAKEVLTYTGFVDGVQYEFSINLIIPNLDDPTTLPYLDSLPTMTPAKHVIQAQDSNLDIPSDEEIYSPTTLDDNTLSVLTEWANAYAQNEGDTLKRITGDRNPDHAYEGIGDFLLEGTPVQVWAVTNNAGTKEDESDDFIVARVAFTLAKNVHRESSAANDAIFGKGDVRFIQKQTMDVLFTDFKTGSPSVSAWGPSGSWVNLKPYSNAMEKKVLEAIQQQEREISGEMATTTKSSAVPTVTSQEKTEELEPSVDDYTEESSEPEETTSSTSKKATGKKPKATKKQSDKRGE